MPPEWRERREVRERAAHVAVDYVHRVASGVAAMAASAGGIEALAFTGGIGEHSALVRQRVADRLGFLGVRVEPAANVDTTEGEITRTDATVRVLVVTAREDLEIADGTPRPSPNPTTPLTDRQPARTGE